MPTEGHVPRRGEAEAAGQPVESSTGSPRPAARPTSATVVERVVDSPHPRSGRSAAEGGREEPQTGRLSLTQAVRFPPCRLPASARTTASATCGPDRLQGPGDRRRITMLAVPTPDERLPAGGTGPRGVRAVRLAMIATAELMGDGSAIPRPAAGLSPSGWKGGGSTRPGYDSRVRRAQLPLDQDQPVDRRDRVHAAPGTSPGSGAATTAHPQGCTRHPPARSSGGRVSLECRSPRTG